MNEFNAQTGGRYVYVDDVLNLQELALAFGRIFDECDNFIISGCSVSGSSIGSGYIYLNGKIRYFSGASGITTWPQYLYENNSTESVHYASGNTKIGRNIYGVSVGSSVPTTVDALTGQTPVSMTITQSGGMLMKDAFFGKYALILNPANLSQVLNSSLKIDGDLEVTGNVRSLKNRYRIIESQAAFDAFFNNGSLTLQTQYDSDSNTYALSMENNVGLKASVNGNAVMQLDSNGMVLPGYIQASLGVLGSVGVSNSAIYNRTEASNTAALNINMVGHNGDVQYYRNTNIGNGKGTAIVSVDGQKQIVEVNGMMTIAPTSGTEGLVIFADKAKTDASIQRTVTWKDSNSATMGTLGYSSSSDAMFRISNTLAGVSIYGATNSSVDLGPTIKENGQLLTDKYLQITNFNNTIANYIKSADVYNKTASDGRFSKVADGFSGYISAGNSQATLRNQIGAASTSDLNSYLSKSAYLSDIATTTANKKKIRDNIGAVSKDDVQTKLKDTGWIWIKDGLYARQIGNVVYVQGVIKTIHSGTLFTIPNSIDTPFAMVNQLIRNKYRVVINGGSRSCNVDYCDGMCNLNIAFSLSYMV